MLRCFLFLVRISCSVMIKSKNGTTPYEGFILQARSVSNSAIVGSFRVDNTNTSQTMNCPGGVKVVLIINNIYF